MTSTVSNKSITLPDYVFDLLNNIAESEGFTNYCIPNNSILNVINGYSGSVLRVKIKGYRMGADDELHLIIKMPSREDIFCFSQDLFRREVEVYRDVLPAFVKFQDDKGLTGETGFYDFPKFYGHICDNEYYRYALILEDLSDHNYETWNNENYLDMKHMKLILERLGKFNAISLAMRDEVPEVFAPFECITDVFINQWKPKEMLIFQKSILDKIVKSLDPNDTKVIEKIISTKLRFYEEFLECVGEKVAGRFGVISHGDLWSNNTMFTYKETIPQAAVIIDWQTVRFASPALDLLFYIFVATDKKLRDIHYEDMLHIYYEAVEKTLNLVGSDARKLLTFNDLTEQLKKFGKFIILRAPTNLQLKCTISADLPSVSGWIRHLDYEGILPVSKRAAEEFYNSFRDVLKDIIALEYY